jgi:hypothetical protein
MPPARFELTAPGLGIIPGVLYPSIAVPHCLGNRDGKTISFPPLSARRFQLEETWIMAKRCHCPGLIILALCSF